jgi:lysophospholipase L1-like esterase
MVATALRLLIANSHAKLTNPAPDRYGSSTKTPFEAWGGFAQAIPSGREGEVVWRVPSATLVGLHTMNNVPSAPSAPPNWLCYVWNAAGTLYFGALGTVNPTPITGIVGDVYIKLARSNVFVSVHYRATPTAPWLLFAQITMSFDALFPMVAPTGPGVAELVSFEVGGLISGARPTPPSLQGAMIAVVGNSITTELYAKPGWPNQLQSKLAAKGYQTTIQSFAVTGQTTRDMIRKGTTELMILPPIDVNRAKRPILCVFEGTNDLLYYGIAVPDRIAKCQQNIRDYCLLRQLEGWYVVLISGSPRANGYWDGHVAQYEADSITLDNLLAETWSDYADAFFYFRQRIPSYVAAPPICGDGVHPGPDGCGLIADRLADFLIKKLG